MENATIGMLFLEVLKTGAIGFLFGAIVSALGRREFGVLIKVTTFVLCAIMLYQMIALIADGIANFFEPLLNFLEKWRGA